MLIPKSRGKLPALINGNIKTEMNNVHVETDDSIVFSLIFFRKSIQKPSFFALIIIT